MNEVFEPNGEKKRTEPCKPLLRTIRKLVICRDAQRRTILYPLLWRHNGRNGVSNHQPYDCLLKLLFRHRSKKTSKLRVTGLCGGIHRWPVNSPHKEPVTRNMFPFDYVIMIMCSNVNSSICVNLQSCYVTVPVKWRHFLNVNMSHFTGHCNIYSRA